MTLTIELSPEQERQLEQAALRAGVAPHAFARDAVVAAAIAANLYESLPRRTPEDLRALAQEQGVGPLDVESLLASKVWPQEEDLDDFLTTLQTWRREHS